MAEAELISSAQYAKEDRRASSAGRPSGEAIHATAVAMSDACVLILGPSRAGKSRLAAALIAASSPQHPIRLVGDDRILLRRQSVGVRARPHPRIAGFLERRGLGIVAYPFVVDIVVAGIVRLAAPTAGLTTVTTDGQQNFSDLPTVVIDRLSPVEDQRRAVLAWWRDVRTTPAAKATRDPAGAGKV